MDRTGDDEIEIVDGSMAEEVDVEMTITESEVIETKPEEGPAAANGADADAGADDGGAGENGEVEVVENGSAPARRLTFIDYLQTPVVEILVGSGDEQTLLTAHQGLLTQSPYFASMCALFGDDEVIRAWSHL